MSFAVGIPVWEYEYRTVHQCLVEFMDDVWRLICNCCLRGTARDYLNFGEVQRAARYLPVVCKGLRLLL